MNMSQMSRAHNKANRRHKRSMNKYGKKTAPTNRSLNRKIKTIQHRQELKWKDTLVTGIEMINNPNTAQIILLNGLAQGDTSSTREGINTTYTSVQLRAEITSNIAASLVLNAPSFRLVIVRDSQPNGIALTFDNVFDQSVITNRMYCPYNLKYAKRFKIIHDQIGTIHPKVVGITTAGTTTQVVPETQQIRFKKRLGTISNYGLGNAGTIADISKHSFYLMLISNVLDADQGPLFSGGIRMIFKDD